MWKDIKGFENRYQVSDDGQVKSLERHVNNGSEKGMMLPEKLLKQQLAGKGYPIVHISKNGRRYPLYVHHLVAEAYLGKRPDGFVVNHKDGNKQNNNVENLEYTTYGQNNQHAYDHDLTHKGEAHYRSKLTAKDVVEIKHNGKCDTYENIAKKYNVTRATIHDVLNNKTWKHISE